MTDPVEKGKIKISLEGLKEESGSIALMIFNKEDGFPDDRSKAVLKRQVKLNGKIKEIEIPELPAGRYAISLIHDVNNNEKLDKNLMGIPTEPFGFSGNKSIFKGLPSFDEAAFELNAAEVECKIELIRLF